MNNQLDVDTFFDIETAPLSDDQILAIVPKGNAQKLVEIRDNALLHATTASVCSIGIWLPGQPEILILEDVHQTEVDILETFWMLVRQNVERFPAGYFFGWAINSFDIPFLVQRSWIRQVQVPKWILDHDGNQSRRFIDLKRRWRCGNRDMRASLHEACVAMFGVGKHAIVTGMHFHKFLHGTDEEFRQAVEYQKRDVALVKQLRNGIL